MGVYGNWPQKEWKRPPPLIIHPFSSSSSSSNANKMSPGTINICKPGNLSNDVYNQLFLVISNLHVNGKTF